MPSYAYQATDQHGELHSGEIAAESVLNAVKGLESRGLSIRSICEIVPNVQASATGEQHSALYHRIDEALDRRETLIPALTALADELPVRSGQRELHQLIDQLKRGVTAADLMDDRAAAVWLPLLVGGVAKEANTRRLSQCVAEAMRASDNRKQRLSALAYPAAVFVLALLVLGAFCALVVPIFGAMYADFALSLPGTTRLLVWCSDQIRFHPLQSILAILFALSVCYLLARWRFRSALTTRYFGFMTAGNSANVSAMASFTHSLAELLSIDASLPEALRIAGRNCQQSYLKKVADMLANHISRDMRPLSEFPMLHSLPPTVIYALQESSEGGACVPLLRELSALYSDRVRMRVEWSSGALAPVGMIAVGALVAFVVVALYMPLVSLISALA